MLERVLLGYEESQLSEVPEESRRNALEYLADRCKNVRNKCYGRLAISSTFFTVLAGTSSILTYGGEKINNPSLAIFGVLGLLASGVFGKMVILDEISTIRYSSSRLEYYRNELSQLENIG